MKLGKALATGIAEERPHAAGDAREPTAQSRQPAAPAPAPEPAAPAPEEVPAVR
ncbi:hypothetical protein JS756_08080 [Streptomyces actuosus]|uniref:Uncharacterized protein n=1 Tax=Streptomyces actuosus TaxID=1885 RepID=A0ABS2VM11_STRAS|nr:hypothetical protein [Streptomyces actuosus]MBN0044070.1 hypothetical protein [Streptomyces actuosus]